MKLIELKPYISANYVQIRYTNGCCRDFNWNKEKYSNEGVYINVDDFTTDLFKHCGELTVDQIDVNMDNLIIKVIEHS